MEITNLSPVCIFYLLRCLSRRSNICAAQYWEGVSETARDFVRSCLTIDQYKRPTAEEALAHPWLSSTTPHFVPDPDSTEGKPTNLLPGIRKAFDARKTCKCIHYPPELFARVEVLSSGLSRSPQGRAWHDGRPPVEPVAPDKRAAERNRGVQRRR